MNRRDGDDCLSIVTGVFLREEHRQALPTEGARPVRDSALVMVCHRPMVMRKAQLAAALRFEFELKIDGKPLGRSDRAMAAFGRYLDRRHRAA